MANLKIKEDSSAAKSAKNKDTPAEEIPTKEENLFDQEGELVVDVFETNTDFVVMSAVAGIAVKDLDISLEKDMMVIKGCRQNPHDDSNQKYFYQECYWGPFSRKVVLPEDIDVDSASAQIDKGLLTIRIPKVEKSSGEKLGVKLS